MGVPGVARERSLVLLSLYVFAYWPRDLLRFLPVGGYLIGRDGDNICAYGHSFYGVCARLGPDEVLGRDGDYQSIDRNPWSGPKPGGVGVRRVCCGKSHPTAILCLSFSTSLPLGFLGACTSCVSTSNGIVKPTRGGQRQGSSAFSSLLCVKGFGRGDSNNWPNEVGGVLYARPVFGAREFYPSQSASYACTYSTRVVFSLTLRHFTGSAS